MLDTHHASLRVKCTTIVASSTAPRHFGAEAKKKKKKQLVLRPFFCSGFSMAGSSSFEEESIVAPRPQKRKRQGKYGVCTFQGYRREFYFL